MLHGLRSLPRVSQALLVWEVQMAFLCPAFTSRNLHLLTRGGSLPGWALGRSRESGTPFLEKAGPGPLMCRWEAGLSLRGGTQGPESGGGRSGWPPSRQLRPQLTSYPPPPVPLLGSLAVSQGADRASSALVDSSGSSFLSFLFLARPGCPGSHLSPRVGEEGGSS